MLKNGLMRKLRLISRYMTSQPREKQLQYTLFNISRSKGNQTIKFSQLIEYSIGCFSSKNHAKNEAERLDSDLFLF